MGKNKMPRLARQEETLAEAKPVKPVGFDPRKPYHLSLSETEARALDNVIWVALTSGFPFTGGTARAAARIHDRLRDLRERPHAEQFRPGSTHAARGKPD